MPTFPIPVFVALVLAYAAVRLYDRQRRLSALVLLLSICSAQSLVIALAQHYGVPGMRVVQPVTASFVPAAAWLAFQTTAVRGVHLTDVLHLVGPAASFLALLVAPIAIDIFLPVLFLAYGGALFWAARQGPDAQPRAYLSDGEIPGLIWRIIGAALMVAALSDVLIVAAQVAGYAAWRPWIISLFSVGNLLVIGIVTMSPHLRGDDGSDEERVVPPEPDTEIWARVTAYMDQERPYLDPDLTLAKLSRRLRVPSKTLSETINRATGENVSRFVNAARIKAAQAAMAEGETVTSAMFAAGFNTKSNFNREFLRVVGQSPSAWLKEQRP